jgi:hypothetical protein
MLSRSCGARPGQKLFSYNYNNNDRCRHSVWILRRREPLWYSPAVLSTGRNHIISARQASSKVGIGASESRPEIFVSN